MPVYDTVIVLKPSLAVKVLRSGQHKAKLEHYSATFNQHKEELKDILHITHTTNTRNQLDTVIGILGRLSQQTSNADPQLADAEEWVRKHGGPEAIIQVSGYF